MNVFRAVLANIRKKNKPLAAYRKGFLCIMNALIDQYFRESAYGYIVNQYTYDSKGRIIRIDSKNNFGHPPYFTTYAYDAAGNKVRTGAVYDNKKSYLRTNAWLMFITRDFSVNNYKVADEYNKKGLPLTYNSTVLTFMNSLVNEFDYNCDHKSH